MAATNREDYTARQAQRDRDHEAAYAKWVASLPPDERRKLKAQGLDKPDLDRAAKKANRTADVGELNLEDESAPGDTPDHFVGAAQMVSAADVIRPLLGIILGNDNPVLTAKCIALAIGMEGFVKTDTAFVTENSIAAEHHLTRAAISKRVVALTRHLCLKPSGVMRSERLAALYRTSRLTSHLSCSTRSTPPPSSSKTPRRSKK